MNGPGWPVYAVGEQAVMSDAVEALGRHMHQEAPDKLMRGQRHGLEAAQPLNAVVFVGEGDAGRVRPDQPSVGDGDAMGVPPSAS